jgi:hypothetical protein
MMRAMRVFEAQSMIKQPQMDRWTTPRNLGLSKLTTMQIPVYHQAMACLLPHVDPAVRIPASCSLTYEVGDLQGFVI